MGREGLTVDVVARLVGRGGNGTLGIMRAYRQVEFYSVVGS